MQYDDMDLSTIERHAFTQGDLQVAYLAGLAMDAEAAELRADDLQNVVDGIRERITEANWRTGKKAELRELIEAIVNELAEGGA